MTAAPTDNSSNCEHNDKKNKSQGGSYQGSVASRFNFYHSCLAGHRASKNAILYATATEVIPTTIISHFWLPIGVRVLRVRNMLARWLSPAHFDRRQDQPWRNCREGTNPPDLPAPAAESVRAHALHCLFPPTTYPDEGHVHHAHLHGLYVYHYGPTSITTTVVV